MVNLLSNQLIRILMMTVIKTSARESILRTVYYSRLFLWFVVLLVVMLFRTFNGINRFSFYIFLGSKLIYTFLITIIIYFRVSVNAEKFFQIPEEILKKCFVSWS
jgi:hypothetical protein